MPSSHDIRPDGPMSPEQAAVAASLSPDFVAKIDQALLSHAKAENRKVAMLVGLTMADPLLTVAGLPDLFYVERVKELVTRGRLIASGDLNYMRYSEVRLA